MYRMLFEKKGKAVWISHLDLMRVFQRAFMRAGFPLTHTQGYNPRPSVSIALPLSVGVESSCELLDFDLDGEEFDLSAIRDGLNATLIEGVRVIDIYQNGRKLKDLTYLRCKVIMQYDQGISIDAAVQIKELFLRESVTVTKKSKNGPVEQDIIPMIKSLSVSNNSNTDLLIDCIIRCQNPSLNPVQLVAATEKYLPELKPDFSFCARCEIFDEDLQVFR